MQEVPSSNWFCKNCSEEDEDIEKFTPPKKKRKIFRDESDDDESNDDFLNGIDTEKENDER